MPTRRFGSQFFGSRSNLPPGTLIDTPDLGPGSIRLIRYGTDGIVDDRTIGLNELPLQPPRGLIDWIIVKGVHDAKLLSGVGEAYGIHSVTLEDLQNTDRRPSFENTGELFYLSVKRLRTGGDFLGLEAETIGVILHGQTVLTFLEPSSDGFPALEARFQDNTRLKTHGADYLVFRIWDQSVDSWLMATELAESHIQDTEEEVLFHNRDELLELLHGTRKKIAWLRWIFLPYRELRTWMANHPSRWFSPECLPYLHDLADHAARVQDLLDVYRNMIVDLLAVHMSILSVRLNSVMKVLTIIATIFIPLTFIAGIYGMNFKHMPELAGRWSYPAVLGFMALVATGMIIYIRRKKWF